MTARRFQEFDSELIDTGMVHDGVPVRLECLVRRPASTPPFPTVVFNHGSMGRSRRKDRYRRPWEPQRFATLLNGWGWMVLLPQRRGIGLSGGRYGEGFDEERGEYPCDPAVAMDGFEHAMTDMRHITAHVVDRPDVDASRLVLAGQSRGGALALTHAAREPDVFAGAFSFVGGWMGRGCDTYADINRRVYEHAGRFGKPTLWLQGNRDRFYGLAHSRELFDRYREEGGVGTFESCTKGHSLIAFQELYRDALKAFLDGFRTDEGR